MLPITGIFHFQAQDCHCLLNCSNIYTYTNCSISWISPSSVLKMRVNFRFLVIYFQKVSSSSETFIIFLLLFLRRTMDFFMKPLTSMLSDLQLYHTKCFYSLPGNKKKQLSILRLKFQHFSNYLLWKYFQFIVCMKMKITWRRHGLEFSVRFWIINCGKNWYNLPFISFQKVNNVVA